MRASKVNGQEMKSPSSGWCHPWFYMRLPTQVGLSCYMGLDIDPINKYYISILTHTTILPGIMDMGMDVKINSISK